jgi:hypothetical protein
VAERKPARKGRALAWQRRRPARRSSRLARVISHGNLSPLAVILAALLLVLILGLLGFAIHVLWWLALAALVIWLLGFFLRVGETIARPPRRRWYYW